MTGLTRGRFLGIGAAAAFAPLFDAYGMTKSLAQRLRLEKTEIRIGLRKPFSVLHVSDTHLPLMSARDLAAADEERYALYERRRKIFPDAVASFAATLAYAEEKRLPILHTGDLIDYVSEANLRRVQSDLADRDILVAPGNHEYNWLSGRGEGPSERLAHHDRVESHYPNRLGVASRTIGGVNFVAMDDVHYRLLPEVEQGLRDEFAKGLPVVLMMHVPFYEERLFEASMARWKECAHLIGTPREKTDRYLPRWREAQESDAGTLALIDWIKAQPLLKAVLAGHVHFSFQSDLTPSVRQYVAGGNYEGVARELVFS